MVAYGYFDCDFLYDGSIWAMVFTRTEDCKFISLYLDFYKDFTVVVIIATVDAITIFKVHLISVKMRKVGITNIDATRKREINFLRQAVLQGIVFAVELYTYFHLAWQYEHRWAVFVLTTVAWNLVHCVDALIIIGFNAEFRRLLKSPKRMFNLGNTVYVDPSLVARLSQVENTKRITVASTG